MYLYPLIRWNKIIVSPSYARYSGLTVHGKVFGSLESEYWRSSYIVAHWVGNYGNTSSHAKLCLNPRPGVIKFFIKHVLVNVDSELVHWFAYREWFRPVQGDIKSKYRKPVEVWEQKLYEQVRPSSFIPVSRML